MLQNRLYRGDIQRLKPSERELADLTAGQIRTERDQEEAAQDLVDQDRCEIVVLSLGSPRCWRRGALCGISGRGPRRTRGRRQRAACHRCPLRHGRGGGGAVSDSTQMPKFFRALDPDQSREASTPPYCAGRRPDPIPAAFPLKPRSPPPGLLSPEAVPNLILTPEETADVAAYTILSLRDQHFRYEPQLASEQFHARLQGHNATRLSTIEWLWAAKRA